MSRLRRRDVSRGLILAAVSALSLAVAGHEDPELLYTFDGGGKFYGITANGAGDVNGDGYDDVIVGTHYGSDDKGIVDVYSGKDGKVLYTYSGKGMLGYGWAVCGVGDLNKDGYDEFVVGVRGNPGAGSAIVYSGKDGEVLYKFVGINAGDQFGWAVSGAGDVNKDGYPDVVVGALMGNARVYSGKDGKILHTFTREIPGGAKFGAAVDGAGDVNNDGYDDVIIGDSAFFRSGVPKIIGAAYVYSGKDGTSLLKIYGQSGDCLGHAVAGVGDVNGDGNDDFAISNHCGGNPGAAAVYSGEDGKTLYTLAADSSDDHFGDSLSGLDDLDGDGVGEIVIGATYDDDNGADCGSARVCSGKDGKTLYTLFGEAGGQFGWAVNDAGDVNADGIGDIVVGAPYAEAVYVYGLKAPTGTVTIDAGAEATSSSSVTLGLTWKRVDADVEDVRLRNGGDAWGVWLSVSPTKSWILSPGEGPKTVEAQFRDVNGRTSSVAKDSIRLDQTAPTGWIEIESGAPWTATPFVHLSLVYTDLQTRVTDMRVRNSGNIWPGWEDASPDVSWTLSPGGGTKTVEAQFRDAAGNVSEVVLDTIEFLPDVTPPSIDSILINGQSRLYLLPEEPFVIEVVARDNLNGSGVGAFKASFDREKTWSDWYPAIGQGGFLYAEVARPAEEGLLSVTVVARDRARNESASAGDTLYFVERNPPWLGSGAKGQGKVDGREDVDAFALDLLAGDTLTVKLKAKALVRKKSFVAAIDLCRPDGECLLKGRYPDDAKKVSILGYEVPETGRYVLIVRRDFESDEERGAYKLTAKVKQTKTNKKATGKFTGTEITFDAVAGSTLKAKLAGEGLMPEHVTLVGPEGEVAIETKGKPGKVAIKPVTLDAGTGTYAIRFAGPLTVAAKWALKLPKIKGTVAE